MMDIFKKAALPSIEDFAKEVLVKRNLTIEISRCVRLVQEENVGKTLITDNESCNAFCYVLEAILIHGLKEKFPIRMTSVFGSDKIPVPQFWTVACAFSHKNVIAEIKRFNMITNDVGRSRSWLRCALNDGLILSYMGTMISDQQALQKFYSPSAYMRDEEQPDIMRQLLEGLSVFTFELCTNDSNLNIWNSLTLTLANVWTPPVTPQPVMPAVDVIDFFTDSKVKHRSISKTSKKSSVLALNDSDNVAIANSDKSNDDDTDKSDISNPVQVMTQTIEVSLESAHPKVHSNNIIEANSEETIKVEELLLRNEDSTVALCETNNDEDTSSRVSSSDSVPDFGIEVTNDLFLPEEDLLGNKLKENSGWSSSFDGESTSETDQTYDSLLQSYNKNLNKVVIGTPELAETFPSAMGKDEDDLNNYSPDTKSPDLDFEIVPKYLALEHADDETKKLMAVVGQICPEKGLDSQNFQCYSCGRPVGLIYGKARLCYYDGCSYCYECHVDDEEVIPGRIVHNWNFNKYPVSKRAKAFISQVIKDPLLDFKLLNPVIYTVVEEMAQLQLLRTQLTFLRSYIFTCKQSIADELRMRLWPREYLFEHVHLYAIDDLLEIPTGQLAQALQKAIVFAKKHVSGCQLCLLKGFICEVCNNPTPIYPFDVESTYHCDRCLAVYHDTCMNANKYCPKCIRRLKRQQALESAASD